MRNIYAQQLVEDMGMPSLMLSVMGAIQQFVQWRMPVRVRA